MSTNLGTFDGPYCPADRLQYLHPFGNVDWTDDTPIMLRTPRLAAALEFNRSMAQMRRRSWPSLQERCKVCNDLFPRLGAYDFTGDLWDRDLISLKDKPELMQTPRLILWMRIGNLVEAAASGCHSCQVVIKALTTTEEGADAVKKICWSPWFTQGLFSQNIPDGEALDKTEHDDERLILLSETVPGSIAVEMDLGIQETTSLIHTGYQGPHFRPSLGPGASTHDDFELANVTNCTKLWLDKCKSEHAGCSKRDLSPLPKRVLDIFGPAQVRLYEPKAGESATYCALSYCWGGPQSTITTKATLLSSLDYIQVEELSRTVQDAILVTHSLGIRYLWVDALCIVQDDIDDWEREAVKMCDVYRGAYLTIAASHSRASNIGMLTKPKSGDYWRFHVVSSSGDFSDVLCHPIVDHSTFGYERSRAEPLFSRGWCLQERLLSMRVLYFTERELRWECQEKTWCECGSFDYTYHGILGRYDSEVGERLVFSHKLWHGIVRDYSCLKFTFTNDKIPALSGITTLFKKAGLGRCIAGTWLGDFPDSFLWKSNATSSGLPSRLPNIPTWSWMSVDCEVDIGSGVPKYMIESQAKLLAPNAAEPVDIMEAEDDLYLTLSALTVPALPRSPWNVKFWMKESEGSLNSQPVCERGNAFLTVELDSRESIPYIHCSCIDAHDEFNSACKLDTSQLRFILVSAHVQGTETGLILAPCQEKSGLFRRIALFSHAFFEQHRSTESFFIGAKLETFTII